MKNKSINSQIIVNIQRDEPFIDPKNIETTIENFFHKKKDDKDYLINQYATEETENQICEDIEWFKILEQGKKINAIAVNNHETGVDTYDDYDYLKNKYEI